MKKPTTNLCLYHEASLLSYTSHHGIDIYEIRAAS